MVDVSHYMLGEISVNHRKKLTNTAVGSVGFDMSQFDLENSYSFETAYVIPGYEHRPDLISNIYYGSPKNWWLLMLVNNVTDPFESFKINEQILIPKII